jgi:hypothetical protein
MRPWQRLAIIGIISCTYVIWNISVLNIRGKINKIAIIKNIGTYLSGKCKVSVKISLWIMKKPGFPTSFGVVLFHVQWFEVRGDCMSCWYWWNCWPLCTVQTFYSQDRQFNTKIYILFTLKCPNVTNMPVILYHNFILYNLFVFRFNCSYQV